AQIGASYGTIGDDLPPATEVLALCNQYNIQRIRLYNPNPSVLQALQGNINISVIVGVANEDIIRIASDAKLAKSWVRNNILKYENVNFRYIAVGNEISPLDGGSAGIAPSVVPAMQNIYNAISAFGLGGKVKVSTALSFAVLGTSYPPSAGAFRPEIQSSYINPIVQFLAKTRGPFLVNVYPYFAYVSNPNDIHLDYALFTSPSIVVRDGKYQYQNLFDAMVDATHAALQKVGGDVEVVVTETGWPSAGGTATTVDNARSYNSNLIKSVRKGTPRKPGKPIETYIFDLIDENQKSPEIEKHWGLFLPNKQPKYPISFAK
ncbi:UNVERIFIED_CONTAM: Glucan endo-1,3-beta-glucosidase, basic isoform, partial [Sesamum indicum]